MDNTNTIPKPAIRRFGPWNGTDFSAVALDTLKSSQKSNTKNIPHIKKIHFGIAKDLFASLIALLRKERYMFVERIGTLEPESGIPLFVQLQRLLRTAIEGGVLQLDEALPPERDLADTFKVSRITVRKALKGLVDDRLLSRRRGVGTFVTTHSERNLPTLSSFSEDMLSRGRRPHALWISRKVGSVNPEEAMALGLSPGSKVYRLVRICFADDQSMALEYTTIPADSLPSVEIVGDSLHDALGEHRPVRVLQRLRAVLFTPEQCELLQITAGAPGLEIERRDFDRAGRTVGFTRSYYRGDAYDLVSEMSVTVQ